MSITDHNVYVFRAGYNALPDSRCKLRKGRDVITKATAAGISLDRETSDQGRYDVAELRVHCEVEDVTTRGGINKGDKVEILQPVSGGDRDWQKFRVGGIKINGGLVKYTLETVDEQIN